jgi:hypothetical protein
VLEGQVQVRFESRADPVTVGSGEMLSLDPPPDIEPKAVQVDEYGAVALRSWDGGWGSFEEQPSLKVRSLDTLAEMGIGVARGVALIGYLMAAAATLVALVILIRHLCKARTLSR